MERRIIIILIILGLLVGGYFLAKVLFIDPNNQGALSDAGVTPPGTTALPGEYAGATVSSAKYDDVYSSPSEEARNTFPKGNRFFVSTAGGTVEVKNFFNTLVGYYPEMNSVLITKNDRYKLEYYRDDNQFVLTISPLVAQSGVKEVQEEVLSTLGADKTNFCKLKIVFLVEYDEVEIENLGDLPLCASVLK